MRVDGVVMGCVFMSVWLYMHLLCMSVPICCYVCIFMVKVVVHEVIVCYETSSRKDRKDRSTP